MKINESKFEIIREIGNISRNGKLLKEFVKIQKNWKKYGRIVKTKNGNEMNENLKLEESDKGNRLNNKYLEKN